MARISSSPDARISLQLEQRKSFSLAVVFRDSEGNPVDITGSTLTLDWLRDLVKLRHPETIVAGDVTSVTAALVEPGVGFARFNVQAADLDLAAAAYPYTITLRSPNGYSFVVAKGDLEVQDNPEFASSSSTYTDGLSLQTIDITLQGSNVITVVLGPMIPPKMNWLSDADQYKLDVLHFVGNGLEIDVTLLARVTEVAVRDDAVLASAGMAADAGDTATLAAAEGFATAGDAATLAAAEGFATAGDAATLSAAEDVATAGDAAVTAALTVPPGVTWEYNGATAPAGWLLENGAAYSRVTYAALFAVIGTAFGAGDGVNTFNVPSHKGRDAIGLDASQTEFNALGKTGGEKTHLLTALESGLRSHSHVLSLGNAGTGVWDGTDRAARAASNTAFDANFRTGDIAASSAYGSTPLAADPAVNAHNNLGPYIVKNFIIKT